MAQVAWFDDLTVGMRFKSPEVEVTEADIKRFAAEFDPQPMHLDHEAAKATLFNGLAASGWHTAAIAMNLAIQTRPFGPASADRRRRRRAALDHSGATE